MSGIFAERWNSWPLLVIWAVGCGARVHHNDHQIATDCSMFGIFIVWLAREDVVDFVSKRWDDSQDWSIIAASWTSNLAFTVMIVLTLTGLHFWGGFGKNGKAAEKALNSMRKWTLACPRPMIFPCRTTHARMFPERHAFGYSYLQCGYPIVPAGTTATGDDVSDGRDRRLGNWWLRVSADDYLERGNGTLGFYGKLRQFLRNQVSVF